MNEPLLLRRKKKSGLFELLIWARAVDLRRRLKPFMKIWLLHNPNPKTRPYAILKPTGPDVPQKSYAETWMQ